MKTTSKKRLVTALLTVTLMAAVAAPISASMNHYSDQPRYYSNVTVRGDYGSITGSAPSGNGDMATLSYTNTYKKYTALGINSYDDRDVLRKSVPASTSGNYSYKGQLIRGISGSYNKLFANIFSGNYQNPGSVQECLWIKNKN